MKQNAYAVVRDASGTYTAKADGVRASSTTGAEWAARRLGEKIFGGRFLEVVQLPAAVGDDHTVTRWRLTGEAAPAEATR